MNLRPRWARAEKALLAAPVLIAAVAFFLSRQSPNQLNLITLPKQRQVTYLKFSPDGYRLLVTTTDSQTKRVAATVYDPISRAQIASLHIPTVVSQPKAVFTKPDWSPDGKRIAMGCSDGRNDSAYVGLWNSRTGAVIAARPYATGTGYFYPEVIFSTDGKELLGVGNPPCLFQLKGKDGLKRFESTYLAGNIAFNANQNLFAINFGVPQYVSVRETASGRPRWTFEASGTVSANTPQVLSIAAMKWSRRDVLAFTASDATNVRLHLWDARSGQGLYPPPNENIDDFSLSNSQDHVAVSSGGSNSIQVLQPGSNKASVLIWDYATAELAWAHEFNGRGVNVKWSPDGQRLAVQERGSGPNHIWIYGREGVLQMERSCADVSQIEWSPNLKVLAVGSPEKIEMLFPTSKPS